MAFEKINPSEQLAATGTPSSTTYLRGDNTWNTPGGGVTGSTTPTSGDAAEWDTNLNLSANGFNVISYTQALSSSTYVMSISSAQIIIFTGTTQNQTVTLPATAAVGQQWLIMNQGTTAAVTCNGSTSGTPIVIAGGASAVLTPTSTTPTTAANWDVQYGAVSVTTGKLPVITNSVTFAGTDGTTQTFPVFTGNVVSPPASAVTLTGPVTNAVSTLTLINNIQVPAASVSNGTAFKIQAWGGNTITAAASTGVATVYVCMGTNGSTADSTKILSSGTISMTGSGTTATNAPIYIEGLVTIRTTGTTGTAIANYNALYETTTNTALVSTMAISTTTATASINMNTAFFIDLLFKSPTSIATTWTQSYIAFAEA